MVGVVPLSAGAGGVGLLAPDDGRAVARWTGGVPDAVPLSAGAEDGVLPLDGCAAARWTGGALGVVPLSAGAEGVELAAPDDGGVVARWTGGVPDAVPLSAGAVAAGFALPDGAGVRRTGLSAAAPLSGRAGEPDGRTAARWTGGVVGVVPLSAGVVGVGLPVPDDGRAVAARWAGGVAGAAPLSAGAGVAGAAGLPVPEGAGVARRAGVSGAGLDGRAAARWTGGVPDAVPLWAGAEGDGLPPSGRRTGAAGAVVSADVPGAGVVPGAGTARCTGAPVGAGAGVTEPWAGEAPPAGAEPGSARSASADEGAVPEDDAVPEGAGVASVVRRLAGNARRCTADDPDGALVSDCRGRGVAGGGTGETRTPRGAWAGVLAGTADDAVPAERARWTGVAEGVADDDVGTAGAAPGVGADLPDVPDAPPRARGAEPLGAAGAVAGASAGIARSGATGIRCTGGVPAGRARGVDEVCRAEESKAPDSRLSPAAGSSTAGDGARVNDGSCHVGRRPPKAASATPVRSAPVARWIGGRPVQAATATGAGPGRADAALPPVSAPGREPVSAGGPVSEGEPAADAAVPPPFPFPPSSRRPRSRSRSPTDQPSAVPRVTRDAIWSVYRRRSWCSRSRIASRLQWKW